MKITELRYQQLENKLNQLIERTFSLLDSYKKDDLVESLRKELNVNKNREELKVAFVGQYNAGKSTIISALTQNKDIQIDSNVATDCSYDYIWNNIKITDTPGILAGKVESHDQRTLQTLKESDLIVYVLTSQLFDDVIFENFIDLAYNQQFKDKMLIVINKMSMETGNLEILENNYRESIKLMFKERNFNFDFDIAFIDAADYIEGVEEGEEDFIELSNFSNFIKILNAFIESKGLIHKVFDTPIRLLRGGIKDVLIDDIDPNFSLIIKQYEKRLRSHKKDLIQEFGYILNDFRDKILSAGYEVSSTIELVNEEEFNKKQLNLNKFIEQTSDSTIKIIEELIEEKNRLLEEDIEGLNMDSNVKLYCEDLQKDLESSNNLVPNYKNSSIDMKLNMLNKASSFSARLTKFTGADKTVGLFAKAGNVSGSQGHKMVYEIGKFFGKKFKPYGAVNIAKKIGNTAKIAGPILAVFSMGLEIHGAVKEEKELKKIAETKIQMNNSYSDIVISIEKQIKENFKQYLSESVESKIADFEQQKMEIIKLNEDNSMFIKAIAELDSDYVDYVEIINKPLA